jgi:YbbR domain-containing protein
MRISRIFDNIEIKLICLLLAIVMWLYANEQPWWLYRVTESAMQSKQGGIKFRQVPVELTDSEEQWVSNPGEITIEVESLSAELEVGELRAAVKLTQEDKVNRRVTLTSDNVVLPEKLIFIKAEPEEIEITPVP